jgi:hypothetical protein
VGGAPDDAAGVYGEDQGVDGQRDAPADQRVERTGERDPARRRLQRRDQRRGHGSLLREHLAGAEQQGDRHGEADHDRELPGARAEHQDEQIADGDPERDADDDLEGAPAALAERQSERDDRRDGREERPRVADDLGGDEPGDQRGQRDLDDRPGGERDSIRARARGGPRPLRRLLEQGLGAIAQAPGGLHGARSWHTPASRPRPMTTRGHAAGQRRSDRAI